MKKIGLILILIVLTCRGYVYAGDESVLAKMGDKKITSREFEMLLSAYPPDKQMFLETHPENKVTLLKRLVQVRLLSEIAKSRNMDRDERIKLQIDNYTDELLAQELLKSDASKITVTEDEVKGYYKINRDAFKVPEMVKARHILINADRSVSDEEKKKAREKAEGLLKKIKAGEDFAKLASEFSDDKGSKEKGGDLGFLARGKMVLAFEDVAFSLKPGEMSEIFETKFGFHILKVEEKKEAGIEPFEAVKEKARTMLLDKMTADKTQQIIDKTMTDAHVELHPELLLGGKK